MPLIVTEFYKTLLASLKTCALQFSHEGQFLIRWKACEELKGQISFREFKLFSISQHRYISKGKKNFWLPALLICLLILFLLRPVSHWQSQKFVNIGTKAGFFCSRFVRPFFDVEDDHLMTGIPSFLILLSPLRCLWDSSPLRHCISNRVPFYYLSLSFPFPPIV